MPKNAKIEDLLAIPNNRKRFGYLKSNIKDLAVFFGAGLSLAGDNAKQWKRPFDCLYSSLNSGFKMLKSSRSLGKPATKDILKSLDQAKECIKNQSWLEAGDNLFDAYCKLVQYSSANQFDCKELYDQLGCNVSIAFENADIKTKNEILKLFNKYFISVFNFVYDEVKTSFLSPYDISSLFFLPFLKCPLITTNIDKSFEEVLNRLADLEEIDIESLKIVVPRPKDDDQYWRSINKYHVFYIHGNVDNHEYLVMTGKQYNNAYGSEKKDSLGARLLLEKLVQGNIILFIGSSLCNDKTVEVINKALKSISEKKRNNTIFPLMEVEKNGRSVKMISVNSPCRMSFNKGAFQEIPLLLLQLIRETKTDYPNCNWCPTPKGNIDGVTCEFKDEIDASLNINNDVVYDTIDPGDNNIHDVIAYLCQRHSIWSHDRISESGKGWNICCIDHSDFDLSGCHCESGKFTPLHNYPIGDTVYVLYCDNWDSKRPTLYKEEAETIKENIKRWREQYYPYYSLHGDGQKEKDPFVTPLRVRVIVSRDIGYSLEYTAEKMREFSTDLEDPKCKNNKEIVKDIKRIAECILLLYGFVRRDVDMDRNESISESALNRNESIGESALKSINEYSSEGSFARRHNK